MADQPAQAELQELTLTDRELAARLSWFISIRWFAGIMAALFLVASWYLFKIRLDDVPAVIAAIFVLFFYNAVLALAVGGRRRRGRLTRSAVYIAANVQVVCDLVLTAVIWHRTGGVENAFGIFFIFPMVWASELLSTRNAWLQAVLGAVLINAVAWGECLGSIHHVHLCRYVVEGQPWIDFVPTMLYQDWAFVSMVGVTLSGALFVTVFLAGTVAGRLRYRERQLEGTYRSLKSVDGLKSHFMRKASHELRAPLAAIHTMLRTVQSGVTGAVDPRQEELIRRAVDRVDTLMDLINDLLRFSRLEAEAGALVVHKPVPFGDVVRRTLELLGPSAAEKSLRLESQILPAEVPADEEGLTELVTNLVSNAIRYTPNGRRISVRLATEDKEIVLTVQDEGIGIAAEDLPHLYEEFFRSEAAKQAVAHGTGMGLAIVHRLVHSYHGTINVDSQPGRGTTFTVRLPLASAK
jgi:signal transduction histidine kinase